MTIAEDAAAVGGDLIQFRRDLHRHPELGLQLPRTQERVVAAIEGLPLEISTGKALTSVVAVLRGGRGSGKTVLLRGDMDALPVQEQTGLEYAAAEGAMHACGHDLHTAMLVGAAQVLSGRRDEIAGDIVFMFQPGEEGDDGAGHMIDEGVLTAAGSQVDAAYALHVTSAVLPAGLIASRAGTAMAAAGKIQVIVHGASGHGSSPHRARDPIPAAAEMVIALQTLTTRSFDIFDPVVITVGTFHAGSAHNVIPDDARFEATVRALNPGTHERVLLEATRTIRGIAAAHGLEVDVTAVELFPATINDAARANVVEKVVTRTFGPHRWLELPTPVAGSEDFSRVLQAVPGAMAFLGATAPGVDPTTAAFNHSSEAVFDDSVLVDGVTIYAELALAELGE